MTETYFKNQLAILETINCLINKGVPFKRKKDAGLHDPRKLK